MITRLLVMMLVMQAIPFTLKAQAVFHDVEANEALGQVKSIKTSWQGNNNFITFSQEGRMSSDELDDADYDADGYIKTAVLKVGGVTVVQTYEWEHGMIKAVTSAMPSLGNMTTTTTREYDNRKVVVAESTEASGIVVRMEYSGYLFDSRGNWIRRKVTTNGETFVMTRDIAYY